MAPACVLAGSRTLTAADFHFAGREPVVPSGDGARLDDLIRRKLRDLLHQQGDVLAADLHALALSWVERPLLEFVLEKTGGNQLRAADILGINRNTLRKKITALGIPYRDSQARV